MTTMRRRKPPKDDAIEHAPKALDKTAMLEVKYINSFKGDFVVEYRGELINSEEEERRRRVYHIRCAVFMFNFYWNEKPWCIDASREDYRFGRLVNDDHLKPNCKMKKIVSKGKPHLCLFATRDINAGEEITYNYGGTDGPWRKQISINKVGEQSLPMTESAETCISITKDRDPQTTTINMNQVGEQSLPMTESAETCISITKDRDPQTTTINMNQVGEQSLPMTESAETCISITKDRDPQTTTINMNQVGEQSLPMTESAETCISITKDRDPQTTTINMNQVREQSLPMTESAETCISITKYGDHQTTTINMNQSFWPQTVTQTKRLTLQCKM